MYTHMIKLHKQISDASACACQEHAEIMQERERKEERGELGREPVYSMCMRCGSPASKCQDHAVSMPSAKVHVKEKWDTSSRKSQ